MKYKVGDKVRIKSLKWYNSNKNSNDGSVDVYDNVFVQEMSKFCGQITKITKIWNDQYKISIDNNYWNWTDEMFEK